MSVDGRSRSPLTRSDARPANSAILSDGRVRVDGKFFARDGERLHLRGVTYGPFAPNVAGELFPELTVTRRDFAAMQMMGVNCLRLYHVPPEWLLHLADECGMLLLISIAWSWHLCFLDEPELMREAREVARAATLRCRHHPCVLGYTVANEISPDLLRWYGPARIERFLGKLRDVIKGADAGALVTCASFPPTEFLDLSRFDFATFNVYLHDQVAFRRYLQRLMIRVGEMPLVLGELGMDTFRHGEGEQARFLGGHLREAALLGVAGSFVFSWTDDWHTGGHQVEDWAFGLCRTDRSLKQSYAAVGEIFRSSPAALLAETPRVSVVVCSYNGGRTLAQCLESLQAIDYPDFEIILVDDGSTDNTAEVAEKFPAVRVIHQPNLGLSEARNVGLRHAKGSVIAYTDSDCFVDPHWLSMLVAKLLCTGDAAAGGPNLSPDDGLVAACVAASPGQPTHVLEDDETAEHIPGCNMAYRREALEAVNGFNPRYRKAGDDVDMCWRLQLEGMRIAFAPGAFVWHHRRHTPAAYFRQQAGYGEAEALLWFDHPNKMNRRGESIWRGSVYGAASEGLRLGRPVIYHGIWGGGQFQTLYQPGPAHWATLPSTLEWQMVALALAGLALMHKEVWPLPVAMAGLSVLVATIRACQAPLPRQYHGPHARLLIAVLHYVQPLLRSWSRYRARLLPAERIWSVVGHREEENVRDRPNSRDWVADFWTTTGLGRQDLLRRAVSRFAREQWPICVDPGWSAWDIEIFCGAWWMLRLSTTQEDHGHGKRRIRVRHEFRSTGYARVIAGLVLFASLVAAEMHSSIALIIGLLLLSVLAVTWRHGRLIAARAGALVEAEARDLGLSAMAEPSRRSS